MSEYEIPYMETEVLFAFLSKNYERTEQLLDDMSVRELKHLAWELSDLKAKVVAAFLSRGGSVSEEVHGS